jgi:hypothetical protein
MKASFCTHIISHILGCPRNSEKFKLCNPQFRFKEVNIHKLIGASYPNFLIFSNPSKQIYKRSGFQLELPYFTIK